VSRVYSSVLLLYSSVLLAYSVSFSIQAVQLMYTMMLLIQYTCATHRLHNVYSSTPQCLLIDSTMFTHRLHSVTHQLHNVIHLLHLVSVNSTSVTHLLTLP